MKSVIYDKMNNAMFSVKNKNIIVTGAIIPDDGGFSAFTGI
jgi:hypothetical protein